MQHEPRSDGLRRLARYSRYQLVHGHGILDRVVIALVSLVGFEPSKFQRVFSFLFNMVRVNQSRNFFLDLAIPEMWKRIILAPPSP